MNTENFNKETENVRRYQTEVTELKNTIMELKNTWEGPNSRSDEAVEWTNDMEHRAVELTQSSKKKKEF